MEIAGSAGAGEVVVEIIFLAGAFADAGHVGVLVNVADQRQPSFASCRAVSGGVEPSVFYAGDQSKSEHAGGGSFRPGLGMVNELPPHAVFVLETQKPLHHLSVSPHIAPPPAMCPRHPPP